LLGSVIWGQISILDNFFKPSKSYSSPPSYNIGHGAKKGAPGLRSASLEAEAKGKRSDMGWGTGHGA